MMVGDEWVNYQIWIWDRLEVWEVKSEGSLVGVEKYDGGDSGNHNTIFFT